MTSGPLYMSDGAQSYCAVTKVGEEYEVKPANRSFRDGGLLVQSKPGVPVTDLVKIVTAQVSEIQEQVKSHKGWQLPNLENLAERVSQLDVVNHVAVDLPRYR